MQDLIGYDEIIENSMRLVIFEALKKVEKDGLLGKHYFIITFSTSFSGVLLPKFLLEKYPEEMTIALQHQYKNLVVENKFFKISLSFKGKYEKIVIPYKAITSFSDPSMNFALKFSVSYVDSKEDETDVRNDSNQNNKSLSDQKTDAAIDLSAKVISLDAFRKNRNVTPEENL